MLFKKGCDTMETQTIPLRTPLMHEIEASLQELSLSWEEFLDHALQSVRQKQELAIAIEELKEMERTGDYGKSYTDVDLMMKELLE